MSYLHPMKEFLTYISIKKVLHKNWLKNNKIVKLNQLSLN